VESTASAVVVGFYRDILVAERCACHHLRVRTSRNNREPTNVIAGGERRSGYRLPVNCSVPPAPAKLGSVPELAD
jgi:hypothetical protein